MKTRNLPILASFFVVLYCYFFVSCTYLFASDVVINEFLVDPDASQWVELYNKGSNQVAIGEWFIDDSEGSEKFTVPSETVIAAGEYKVFESGKFNLNRASADTIRLLNGTAVEDSYSYATGPGQNNTYGRSVDGDGEWVAFSSPTKGGSNNSAHQAPLPTPTPTRALTATPTPSPTKIPTPTKAPTPTKTPTPAKSTPTLTQIKSVSKSSPIDTGEDEEVSQNRSNPPTRGASVGPTSVLGESTLLTPANSQTPTQIQIKNQKTHASLFGPGFLLVVGVIFLASCGIIGLRVYKKGQLDYGEGSSD